MLVKFWIVFLTIQLVCNAAPDPNCHEKYVHYGHHLATKSPYRQPNKPLSISGQCHFERIWLMVRHGTRAPSKKVIQQMKERLPELRNLVLQHASLGLEPGLCEADVKAFKEWQPRLKKMEEKTLFDTGEEEMIRLAENFQSYFPDLFPGNYSTSSYLFRYTATQRTAASARAFAIGLFGAKMSLHVQYPSAVRKDPVLRFYKLCKHWKKQIHDNPDTVEEKRKFDTGPEMSNTLAAVSRRLGFNFKLPIDDVRLMYVSCAFETALYPWRRSPWCAVFSEEDLKVLEFAEDLEYYWVDGYGHNITYEQACPAVRDMAQRIIPNFMKQGIPPATVYFTHSGALLKMLSRMNLYKDSSALTHDCYQSLHSRLWKVSNIDTFGSNLAFVLSRCPDGYYVLTLHQEKPVRLPGCDQQQDLCPLHLFLKIIQDVIYHCNFEKLCFS